MSAHEFTEDVADGSMCICGVPTLTHHLVEQPDPEPWPVPGSVAIATIHPRGAGGEWTRGVLVVRGKAASGDDGWYAPTLGLRLDDSQVTVTSRAVVVTEVERDELIGKLRNWPHGPHAARMAYEWFAALARGTR